MYPESESENLELKRINTSSFLKTVSAFANFRDGDIIFGVEDGSREIAGISDVEQVKMAIENAINDALKPVPTFKIEVETMEEKEIIILHIYKGDNTPYLYKGKAYRRQNTASVPVGERLSNKLILDGSRITYEELLSANQDLKFSLLKKKLTEVLDLSEFTNDTLRTLGLMNGDNFTNVGEFFADSSKYPFGVDVARFGENDSIFLERVEITGVSLLSQYYQMLELFDKWYSSYEEVIGFFREKRIQIPREAFREAIANAIIHRDYLYPGSIKVSMSPEQIEIISPGGLVAGIPMAVYLTRELSLLRNRNTAEIFHRLNIVEKFGTGFKRIKRAYQNFKQIPLFEEIAGTFVSVILPRVTYADSESEWNDYEYGILEFVKQEIETTSSEIMNKLGGSSTGLKRTLNKLIESEKIIRVGKGRGTRYRIRK